MKKIIYLLFILSSVMMLGACGGSEEKGDKKDSTGSESVVTDESLPIAVCIIDGMAIRAEPNSKGKYVTGLSIGESFVYMNETHKDSVGPNNVTEYAKVQLSDGTTGWVKAVGVIVNAKTAVVINETPIYKRPDMLTASKTTLPLLHIVAITESKEEWFSFVGENKRNKGWLREESLSTSEEDVALAVLASKELKAVGPEKSKLEVLESIIEQSPYPNCKVMSILTTMRDEETEGGDYYEEPVEEEYYPEGE